MTFPLNKFADVKVKNTHGTYLEHFSNVIRNEQFLDANLDKANASITLSFYN